jgi:hypothetical protein
MSGYEQGMEHQYLARLKSQIATFVQNYDGNPSDEHTTIFLFPGGFASQLVRAEQSAPAGPPFAYDPLWLTCAILSGGAINLQMAGDQDFEQRYIVPDGYVDFLTLRPYGGFADWCAANRLDLFVFGWDWRRKSAEAADFFLQQFLPLFEAGVAQCSPSPLDNFWLIGHSFGGIVVKRILNESANPYVQRMKGAITVGTPFYGYGGQLHRFFVGDPDLNGTEGVEGATIVTEICSTLPAGYELMFLDGPTYDANAAAFASDPEGYALTSYPCMDAATAGLRADPYNPSPGKPAAPPAPTDTVRYLPQYLFDWDLLSDGQASSHATSQSLDSSVAGKFWNIRCVQTQDGAAASSTVVSQSWSLVPASYVPDPNNDPIADAEGPGDTVIPAWSARLLGNPNVITIANDQIEHMDLMNDGDVQTTIGNILNPATQALSQMRATAKTVKMRAADRRTLNDVTALLRGVDRAIAPLERRAAVRSILKAVGAVDAEALPALMARAYMDALKSPSQKLGAAR